MKIIIAVYSVVLFSPAACKKSTSEAPQGNPDHQVTAIVTVKTAKPSATTAKFNFRIPFHNSNLTVRNNS